jgi:hypothetical protein
MKQEKYLTMKELVGKLPHPLPQTYAGVKNFIMKNEKEIKPKKISKGKWVRYAINEKRLDAFIKKVLN